MTPSQPVYYLARFVLEAKSPFVVSTGVTDNLFDNLIVKDANDLPGIPGTTLAGVLRHQYQSLHQADAKSGETATNNLFGFAGPNDKGEPSKVAVSWGYIHDSNNIPVVGLRQDVDRDGLLERLQQAHLIQRDRVRISPRGVASDQAKFNVTLAPRGCRFSAEISLWSDHKDNGAWSTLLNLLAEPIYLGRSTRSGYGHFEVISLQWDCFDFRENTDWNRYRRLPKRLDQDIELAHQHTPAPKIGKRNVEVSLHLTPEDYWRFGQPGAPFDTTAEHDPNDTIFTEPYIAWNKDNQGDFDLLKKKLVVPASGVKGAISHRTLFHLNRLNLSDPNTEEDGQREPPVEELFGTEKDSDGDESKGYAGLLFFNDVYLDVSKKDVQLMQHNSIDRFTGGTINGALFSEELVWQKGITINIKIDHARATKVDSRIRKAFSMALDDLAQGRLALGAASNRGHGYFSGEAIQWSDNGEWINAKPDQPQTQPSGGDNA